MGPAPASCVSCGRALVGGPPISTAEYDPGAATLPPDRPAETETQIPAISASAAAAEALALVGNYRLLRRLSGGGMGDVYEAEEVTSGRRAALKLVRAEYATSEEAVERFQQEGELASRLSHPRCVFVLAADQHEGRPYMVMELMTGETLNDLVKDNGRLPVEVAIRKILDVIDGLEEAHRLGLVHRDVKPSNCFLEANGRVKIGDFGLAKSLLGEAHLTKTGTFLGTPLFAAPEQIKHETVDAQSDVYSVAATLYFLLTGQAPFQTGDALASMARIVSDDAPSMRMLRPELPRALDKVVPCIVVCAAVVLLLVTCMTRGGLSFLGARIRVVRTDGRRASRLRCVWRMLLAGASLGVVGGLSYLGVFAGFLLLRQSLALALALWAAPAVLLGFYGWLLLRDPSWSPHDHVAGTRLVPQ
jgi:serine/threonine protein kinase